MFKVCMFIGVMWGVFLLKLNTITFLFLRFITPLDLVPWILRPRSCLTSNSRISKRTCGDNLRCHGCDSCQWRVRWTDHHLISQIAISYTHPLHPRVGRSLSSPASSSLLLNFPLAILALDKVSCTYSRWPVQGSVWSNPQVYLWVIYDCTIR